MTTTWTIAIDWDRNSEFTGTYDDVTARVISAKWALGMREAYEHMADEATLDIVLENVDGRYSPENGASPLAGKIVPQRPVRIQSSDGTTTRTHWQGWIEGIEPQVGKYGKRTVRITAMGAMQFLKAAETRLPLQENKRTDQILDALIREVVMPPALNRAWILGRAGNSEVGATMYLADTSAYSTLDAGQLTLAMAGDNWVIDGGGADKPKNSFDVYRAISDIVAAERGRFFFDREGRAVFHNRHRFLLGGSPAATFTDTMNEMVYGFAGADFLKNEVTVICHPRTIGTASDTVLWELPEEAVIEIAAGKTRDLYIKYEDEAGKRVGGRDVYVDLATLMFEQGTAVVTVTSGANGADIKIVNNSSIDALMTKLQIKGRKILDKGEMEVTAFDGGSAIDYGRRTMRVNLPSIDNLEQGQYIADFERDRRKLPKGMTTALSLKSHGINGGQHHPQQLALTVGDIIRVEETQTAEAGDYYIIGEAHELTHGATLWKTTWYLEPAPTTSELPWQLGVVGRSELGAATRVTY
jgi:hypothetical protein